MHGVTVIGFLIAVDKIRSDWCDYDQPDKKQKRVESISGKGSNLLTRQVVKRNQDDVNGDVYYTGTATVTGITRQASIDGIVEASFSFQGSGALTESTVSI